jgi:hypothetical protein
MQASNSSSIYANTLYSQAQLPPNDMTALPLNEMTHPPPNASFQLKTPTLGGSVSFNATTIRPCG